MHMARRQARATLCALVLMGAWTVSAPELARAREPSPPAVLTFEQHAELPPGAGGSALRHRGLGKSQAGVLESLQGDPRVSGLRIADSSAEVLAEAARARALSLPSPVDGSTRAFTAARVEHHDEGMVSLQAGNGELGDTASLVVQGADVLGSYEVDGTT